MKLERNHNIYQIVDKSIEEINRDLKEIDFRLGILNFSQKARNFSAATVTAFGAFNTYLYVKNDEMYNCLFALLFIFLASRDIKKSKKNDIVIDELYEKRELLNEIKKEKTKKLTR